ncbi:helix-turn-helix domain-containing protein [Streptomycetaceae bacterium NBC_01309]
MAKRTGAAVTAVEFWTADETAAYLRRPKATLYQWRYKGTGPEAVKVGRGLLYDPAKVRAWLGGQVAA